MDENKKKVYDELKHAVKIANDRLYKLEKSGNTDSPAYKIAVNDIRNILGKTEGKPRFSRNTQMSYNQAEKIIRYAKKFTNYASSTRTGMKRVVNKRSATMRSKYNATSGNLTILYRLFADTSTKQLMEQIPSDIVVKTIVEASQAGKSIRQIRNSIKKALHAEDDSYIIDKLRDSLDL